MEVVWALQGAQWLSVLWTIGMLVVLEGLLSADNALVLAMMVRHLPRPLQKRALRYGIIGAFVFRLIAVVLASVLLDFWYLEVFGGLYLIYLAVKHFAFDEPPAPVPDDHRPTMGFGGRSWRSSSPTSRFRSTRSWRPSAWPTACPRRSSRKSSWGCRWSSG